MAKRTRAAADLVGKVVNDYGEDCKPHAQYVRNVDEWYKAYRGVLELRSRASEWRSKLAPSYIFQVVETLTANVVDPAPRWAVRPQPRMASQEEIIMLNAGAKANELLLNEQIRIDHLAEKKSAFAKQAFIANMSVWKTYWKYEQGITRKQQVVTEQDSATGLMVQRVKRVESKGPVKDDPTAELVDVRDFVVHQGAVSLDKAQRVTHRCYYSFDELKRLEQQGVYGPSAGGESVDILKDAGSFKTDATTRETELFSSDRTKDQIEVLEQWRRQPDGSLRVVAVGNRNVLLRDAPSPFWHNEFPFVICTPVPDIGRIPGISLVGQIADLQEAAWALLNQRMDNTELLNNAIVLIRDDLENTDQLEWAPGAQWFVQDPSQVRTLDVNPISAQISLAAEDKLKQDLQNIPGAAPSLLGQSDSGAGAQTATEVSITANLAQRRIQIMKQQFRWADARLGSQWLAMNQQFLSNERVVQSIGRDGAAAWEKIHPLAIQGDYYLDLDSMDESLMRQERRAESQAKLQVAIQALPAFASMAQAGGPLLNLKAFMDDYLDAFNVDDTAKYYSNKPAAAAPPAGGGPPPSQGPPMPSRGVTAPQASDATSPSNATSMSPMAAMQQMLAATGGPNNIG